MKHIPTKHPVFGHDMSPLTVLRIAADKSSARGTGGSTFAAWWHNKGSGMRPLPGEDAEAHVHRICEIAWANGFAKGNAIRQDVIKQMPERVAAAVAVPATLYHGTHNEFIEFKKGRAQLVFLSDNPDFSANYGKNLIVVTTTAERFADLDHNLPLRERVITAFNKSNFRNTDDGYSDKWDRKTDETWELMESPGAVELLKRLGYEGAKFKETSSDGTTEGTSYAVFDPKQIHPLERIAEAEETQTESPARRARMSV